MKYNLCQLDGLSCIGCCGHSYRDVEKIKQDVKKNTDEWEEIREPIAFRDRANRWDLRESGICKNAIEKDGKLFCPLHPCQNEGLDFREGHCEVDYMCNAFKEFLKWDDEKKERFISFIRSRNLDSYHYSIFMDSDKLLEEFKIKEAMICKHKA